MSAADYVNFYLAECINILPIDAGSKNPTHSWKRYQKEMYESPQTLKDHSGNFFVVCGRVSDNLKILDIETWDVYEKYFSDIASFTVKTPHGGVHIYYRHDDDLSRIASVNGWPVEIRGEGHGCTSAGSTFEGKQYEVIKDLPIIKQDLSKLAHERLIKLSDERENDIQRWKQKIDISKVIAKTVEPTSQNKGCWMGICPFHYDTNPSLAVYNDSYYCFGCGEHGDVINWVEKRDGIGFQEAVQKLSEEFGVEPPKLSKHSSNDPRNWSSDLKVADKSFEVQCIAGKILINRFDVTEFIRNSPEKRVTEAKRKRISEAHKHLKVDDLEWAELIEAVNKLAHSHRGTPQQSNSGKKSLEECPYIIITYDEYGSMKIFPNSEKISAYLLDKFNLMAIFCENQVEGLALWIRNGNEYNQLPKSDDFMIKEMMIIMEEYGLSGRVNENWISRLEILRQSKVKRIVEPMRGMFPVANGILDIKNMRLLTEDDGKICLVRSGVVYNPAATCPEFDKFLKVTFNNDKIKIEAILSWLGAIIAGLNPEIIIMLKSRGRSGKGVLMEVVAGVLGNMITTMSPNKLHERFSNWAFLHRRADYLEEHDGKDATIKAMKELSGGLPGVVFETKGVQAQMTAPVQCAIFINTNNPPPFEKGAAWEERFKMLDFPNTYVDEPKKPWEKKKVYGLKGKVMQELPGILNKLLPYAKYALDHPEKMFKQDIPYKDIEAQLERSTESLNSFINDCCELAPIEPDLYGNMKTRYDGYSVTDTTFMKKYEDFCARPDVNTRASASKYVKDALKQNHRVLIEGHKMIGIRLKEEMPTNKKSPALDSFTTTAAGT